VGGDISETAGVFEEDASRAAKVSFPTPAATSKALFT
jgi:hypothetical protein